jgi:hypothetical protein
MKNDEMIKQFTCTYSQAKNIARMKYTQILGVTFDRFNMANA